MNKADFENLYNTHSIKELCWLLNCTAPTIYARLEEYGIAKKGRSGNRKRRKVIIGD